MRITSTVALASVSLMAITAPAFGQDKAPAADDAANGKDIVVTGTLIRGNVPASSQSIGITADAAKATGAATTAALLASMPQSGFFGTLPVALGNNSYQKSVNRPTLRNLDGGNNGTNPTLLVLNGHRLPGMGVISNSPDLDAIPASALQRIDIAPDGGSATYGADAVGGVMNLITMRTFSGVKVAGNIGFADKYKQYNGNITVGGSMGKLNGYVTYDYSFHDPLYGRDRSFVQRRDWVNDVLQDTNCTPATIRIGTLLFASPTATGSATVGGNRCDRSDDQTFYPNERKHSVYGRMNYDASDSLSLSVEGFFTWKENKGFGQPLVGSVGLTSASSFYQAVTGQSATAAETILFNYASVIPATQRTKYNSWGITPSVRYDIGAGWQANLFGNFGVTHSYVRNQAINTSYQATIGAATNLFNPFNLTAAGNANAISQLRDLYVYGKSTNTMANGRLVFDGPLFTMGNGSQVKLAVGAELTKETYALKFSPSSGSTSAQIAGTTAAGCCFPLPANGNLPFPKTTRSITSLFGELNIPFVTDGGAGMHALTLSVAGRYDKYTDTGAQPNKFNTFNPKIGLTYEPVAGFKFRGNWSRAFQAPGLADSINEQPATITDFLLVAGGVRFANPGVAVAPGQTQLALGGGGIGLKPQTAETWSIGVDFAPEGASWMKASFSYYNVTMRNRISIPSIFASNFYSVYPSGTPQTNGGFYIQNPTAAQISAFYANVPGAVVPANYLANPGLVYNLLYSGKANLATDRTSGIDYDIKLNFPTGFGKIFANFSGELILKFDRQVTATAAGSRLNGIDSPMYRGVFTLGAEMGNLLAQASLSHSGGYNVTPLPSALNQSTIGAFDSLGMYIKYDFKGSGMGKDLTMSLNIDNLLNQQPPLYRGTFSSNSDGYGIGNPLGRLISIGVSKKF